MLLIWTRHPQVRQLDQVIRWEALKKPVGLEDAGVSARSAGFSGLALAAKRASTQEGRQVSVRGCGCACAGPECLV